MNIELLITEDEQNLSSVYTEENLSLVFKRLPENVIVVSNKYLQSVDLLADYSLSDKLFRNGRGITVIFENSEVSKNSNARRILSDYLLSTEVIQVSNDLLYVNYNSYKKFKAMFNEGETIIDVNISKTFSKNPSDYMYLKPVEVDYVVRYFNDEKLSNIKNIILVKPFNKIINKN